MTVLLIKLTETH